MNLRSLRLKQIGSSFARYQPYSFKPGGWPKPNNVNDNLDPNRLDRNIKPEEYILLFKLDASNQD
jgi:hypothetical protein